MGDSAVDGDVQTSKDLLPLASRSGSEPVADFYVLWNLALLPTILEKPQP